MYMEKYGYVVYFLGYAVKCCKYIYIYINFINWRFQLIKLIVVIVFIKWVEFSVINSIIIDGQQVYTIVLEMLL